MRDQRSNSARRPQAIPPPPPPPPRLCKGAQVAAALLLRNTPQSHARLHFLHSQLLRHRDRQRLQALSERAERAPLHTLCHKLRALPPFRLEFVRLFLRLQLRKSLETAAEQTRVRALLLEVVDLLERPLHCELVRVPCVHPRHEGVNHLCKDLRAQVPRDKPLDALLAFPLVRPQHERYPERTECRADFTGPAEQREIERAVYQWVVEGQRIQLALEIDKPGRL
mmetsp:Transcript_40977/g.101124  ORF Transcript_40977/g.101124 Transcript_40977/m.101124 type:complete len:225 (-) Transcript_40977:346-1020(-)